MNTKTSILMDDKARRPLGCGMRKFGILLTVMAAAIIALPNTVTNDVVVATSDAELRISDRDLGLGLEVVGGGAAEVKLETRPGWRFRDGRTVVTLNKAAGEVATSPEVEGEGKGAESYVPGIDVGDDDEDGDDEDGSVEHEKPVLSLSASAPRIVAYSVNDGGASVSISLSATVTKEGIHREVDSGGNVIEEKNFSPQRYSWTMSGADSATKETSSDTCTFTARLTKGENKVLNFSVVGKDCEYCDEDVETSAATDSVTIDVYELRFVTPCGDPASSPDASMPGQNEFTYVDRFDGGGGAAVAIIHLVVGIDPAISVGRVYGGRFSVPQIEGVETIWEDGRDGRVEVSEDIEGRRNYFTTRVRYKNYPVHNSSFGRKTAGFTFAGVVVENDFELFFPKSGNNHPVCPTCEGCPNWFYYWKDGDVCSIPDFVVYTNKAYYGAYSRRKKRLTLGDSAPLQTGEEATLTNREDNASTIQVGASGKGVRCVAITVLHECRHKAIGDDYSSYMDIATNVFGFLFAWDDDFDGVVDAQEIAGDWGVETSPRNKDTFDIAGRFGESYSAYGDDELRARLAERNISRANYHPELDWCNPGCQTATPYGPEE